MSSSVLRIRKFNQGNKLTDPQATEGVLGMHRGVYLVYAVTTGRRPAQAFLASFRPV